MANFANLNAGAFDNLSWESSVSTGTGKRLDRDFYRLKPDKPTRVRFVTNPSGMQFVPEMCYFTTEDGTWAKYREAKAFDGCKGDIEISHKFVPVIDFEVTSTGGRRDRKDTLQQQIRPSDGDLKNKRNYASAKDVMIVNVVFDPLLDMQGNPVPVFGTNSDYEPQPGEVILLALSPLQARAFATEMETASKYADFSFAEGAWTLLWNNPNKANPSGWNLKMQRDLEVPPLEESELVVIDPLPILTAIRHLSEAEVFGGSTLVDDGGMNEEIVAAAMVEVQAEPENTTQSLGRRSPAYVKGMLRKAGVNVPLRITNEDLYTLAAEHGVEALAS